MGTKLDVKNIFELKGMGLKNKVVLDLLPLLLAVGIIIDDGNSEKKAHDVKKLLEKKFEGLDIKPQQLYPLLKQLTNNLKENSNFPIKFNNDADKTYSYNFNFKKNKELKLYIENIVNHLNIIIKLLNDAKENLEIYEKQI